jgi:8-oxo-dGTP pyrophosphatase MutT (NUDIX family)
MTKKTINRAGAIPYFINEDGEIEMMFMKPSDPKFGGDTYQIAKGKCEEGETIEETGIREAGEELGLFKYNIDGDTHNLGTFLGRTTIFVCKVKDKEMFGDPCFETGSTIWWTPEQFEEKGRPLHRPIIKAAVRWINKKK